MERNIVYGWSKEAIEIKLTFLKDIERNKLPVKIDTSVKIEKKAPLKIEPPIESDLENKIDPKNITGVNVPLHSCPRESAAKKCR